MTLCSSWSCVVTLCHVLCYILSFELFSHLCHSCWCFITHSHFSHVWSRMVLLWHVSLSLLLVKLGQCCILLLSYCCHVFFGRSHAFRSVVTPIHALLLRHALSCISPEARIVTCHSDELSHMVNFLTFDHCSSRIVTLRHTSFVSVTWGNGLLSSGYGRLSRVVTIWHDQ
jgi:hypothetical protein